MKGKITLTLILIAAAGFAFVLWGSQDSVSNSISLDAVATATSSAVHETDSVSATLPNAKTISGLAHVGQTFNNCSSVGLMIALSHWGVRDTQEAIAEATRPWNNPRGDNDDKSVTLYELADYARARHGVVTYVRPNGNIDLLKRFVANDIPVLTRALMYPDDDIVHYRVIRGYDDAKQIVIESDGIEGPNQPYSYTDWMHMWKDFNYSYLIVAPKEKQELVELLLGEDADEQGAWQRALARAEQEVARTPSDVRAQYNIVTASYYLGNFEASVREFEKIAGSLTRRKLWYQMEPIDAYFRLGRYDRVLELSDSVINDNNKAVSELYVLKGKIFESRGNTAAAHSEYEKAVQYHKNFKPAQDALAALVQ